MTRLYDTYSRSLVELPPPPGPVRMYFCGPTVYARAHIGNARPFAAYHSSRAERTTVTLDASGDSPQTRLLGSCRPIDSWQ